MKKINLVVFCITSLLNFSSCKKTTTTPNNTNSTNNTNTGYYAILSISGLQSMQNGVVFPATNFCKAYFSTTPVPIYNTSTFAKVTSVSLNNTRFKFNAYDYEDSTYQISYPTGVWVVNGLGNIPSFIDTINTPLPTYTGYNSLPDTLHRAQSLILPITNVSGYDEVQVTISDGSNATGHIYGEVLAPGASSVTFPQGTLSQLNTGNNNAFINIHLIKNNPKTIAGKSINFTTEYQFDKTISVK